MSEAPPCQLILNHGYAFFPEFLVVQFPEFIECFLVTFLQQKDIDLVSVNRLSTSAPPEIDEIRILTPCGGNVFGR